MSTTTAGSGYPGVGLSVEYWVEGEADRVRFE